MVKIQRHTLGHSNNTQYKLKLFGDLTDIKYMEILVYVFTFRFSFLKNLNCIWMFNFEDWILICMLIFPCINIWCRTYIRTEMVKWHNIYSPWIKKLLLTKKIVKFFILNEKLLSNLRKIYIHRFDDTLLVFKNDLAIHKFCIELYFVSL